jgi:bacteriorhodopsin
LKLIDFEEMIHASHIYLLIIEISFPINNNLLISNINESRFLNSIICKIGHLTNEKPCKWKYYLINSHLYLIYINIVQLNLKNSKTINIRFGDKTTKVYLFLILTQRYASNSYKFAYYQIILV